MTSFFRRLTFAPDGSLLFTPAGHYKTAHPLASDPSKTAEDITNTVYIYTRAGFNKPPVAHLPGHKKPSVAVKCSPIFYTLRQGMKAPNHITIDTASAAEAIPLLPESVIQSQQTPQPTTFMEPPPLTHQSSQSGETSRPTSSPAPPEDSGPVSAFALPYRMIYAVATQDAVFVYDTQQTTPLCVVSNLHFATFSDLSWYVQTSCVISLANMISRSNDGLTLLMSSTDGFCSTLSFAPGELGTVYTGPHPTLAHPTLGSVPATTSQNTLAAIPTPPLPVSAAPSPSLTKVSPVPIPPAQPSPAPTQTSFNIRSHSPTRSNSQSSIATMSSISNLANNPTPTLGHVPLVTAANSAPPVGIPPMTTPPQTPLGGYYGHGGRSASGSVSESVLGKRDTGGIASESDEGRQEDGGARKKRRIAPTLIQVGYNVTNATAMGPEKKEEEKEQE
jgi:chromatin assembly factor 1 subunit B